MKYHSLPSDVKSQWGKIDSGNSGNKKKVRFPISTNPIIRIEDKLESKSLTFQLCSKISRNQFLIVKR